MLSLLTINWNPDPELFNFFGISIRYYGLLWIIGLVLAAGLDGIENRMELSAPVNRNLFIPDEAAGLGLETLPASLEEAVEVARNSEFLHKFLPDELSRRYYAEALRRCEALKNASDPAEYERVHYFNAI